MDEDYFTLSVHNSNEDTFLVSDSWRILNEVGVLKLGRYLRAFISGF